MNVFEVQQRGYDTSGRPLKNTRLKWAAFDRINSIVGGWLVIVQGAFMGSGGADASAGTHFYAGCNDVRRWNHSSAQAKIVIDVANTVGDIYYERFEWEGFDPHYHNLLPNDRPLHPDAQNQVYAFNRGENALASRRADPHRRPSRPLPLFTFEEDDMFEDADRQRLARLEEKVDNVFRRVDLGFDSEKSRDQDESKKMRELNRQAAAELAAQRDQQGALLNMLREDDSPNAREIKKLLKKSNARLVEVLRAAESTTGTPDDPSDEAVDQDKALAEKS